MQSADHKVVVDVVRDLGNGLHEMHVFVRAPGDYTICAAVRTPSFRNPTDGIDCPRTNWSMAECTVWHVQMTDESVAAFERANDRRRAAALAAYGGVECAHPDAFRSGHWLRLERCDGRHCTCPHCEDDMKSVIFGDFSNNGWIWASDYCVIPLSTSHDAWRIVDGHWVAAWGDSTLQ